MSVVSFTINKANDNEQTSKVLLAAKRVQASGNGPVKVLESHLLVDLLKPSRLVRGRPLQHGVYHNERAKASYREGLAR